MTTTAVERAGPIQMAVQYIARKLLIPTPDNPRTVTPTQPEVLELAESIRARGILQPLFARPHPTQAGKYDLLAGERRFVAAGLAELAEVPVIVQELTDEEALSLTLVENMQREN